MTSRGLSTLLVVLALASVPPLSGCSDNGNAEVFAKCGNGILDPGEQCDDGNTFDDDDCLSTCVLAICGDGFVDKRDEDCDGTNLNGNVCFDLGFTSGTLQCTPLCYFDTSGCVAPTPTVTPTATNTPQEGASPTPAPPTPTPTVVTSCESAIVTVSLRYDPNEVPQLAGATVDLDYPADALDLPGSGSDQSVLDRITDLSGAEGFFQIDDRDTDSDGLDDQLRNAYATTTTIPPGGFEQVVFDCRPDTIAPSAADFSCIVAQTSDGSGFPVEGVSCDVEIATEGGATPTPTETLSPTAANTLSATATATPSSTAAGSATVPATATATIPATPAESTTPTATTASAVCGNGTVESGETCDDGNTLNGDTCPSDCTIQVCAPAGNMRTVAVSFTPPTGASIGSLTVLLEYPDGTVQIPGSGGDASVSARITNKPSGFLVDGFDLDYALRVAVAGSRALTAGELFRVNFDNCTGSTAPGASDFSCSVQEAFDTSFGPVSGVTCSASLP